MDKPARITIFFIALIGIFLLGAMLSTALLGKSILDGSSSDAPKYKITCDGTIDVPVTFGDPSITGQSCNIEKCGLLTLSILPDFLTDSGDIRLVVNGVVQNTASWESNLGNDQQFTLTSSCISDPKTAVIQLWSDNNVVSTKEVTLQ